MLEYVTRHNVVTDRRPFTFVLIIILFLVEEVVIFISNLQLLSVDNHFNCKNVLSAIW